MIDDPGRTWEAKIAISTRELRSLRWGTAAVEEINEEELARYQIDRALVLAKVLTAFADFDIEEEGEEGVAEEVPEEYPGPEERSTLDPEVVFWRNKANALEALFRIATTLAGIDRYGWALVGKYSGHLEDDRLYVVEDPNDPEVWTACRVGFDSSIAQLIALLEERAKKGPISLEIINQAIDEHGGDDGER
jgi:hypothetical protein